MVHRTGGRRVEHTLVPIDDVRAPPEDSVNISICSSSVRYRFRHLLSQRLGQGVLRSFLAAAVLPSREVI